jgi:type I restriction enzyme S subunit
MNRYDKYKSSNVDWIGEIPSHWELKSLKRITVEHRQGYYSSEDYVLEGVKLIRITDLEIDASINYDSMPYIPISEKDEKVFQVKDGDFLFPRTGSIELFGMVQNPERAIFASYLINFRFDENIHKNFLKYYFFSQCFRIGIETDLHGGVNKNIHAENIKNQIVPLPLPEEQTAIANYLSKKTAEIDKLNKKKQKQIELLKEERTAIFNKLVSGESKNWERKKLKYLVSKVGSGITPKGGANVYRLEGIPLLRSQNIYSDRLVLDDVAFISKEIDEQMANSRIQADDVLLNITGASIGRCFYVPKEFGPGNVNQHVCIIRPIQSRIRTEYLHSFLVSSYGQTLIDICQNGANREGLNFQQIKSFEIPLPSISEQEHILKQLQAETKKIDSTISKINNEIQLIHEYQIALVSEVVTGKIKVIP